MFEFVIQIESVLGLYLSIAQGQDDNILVSGILDAIFPHF